MQSSTISFKFQKLIQSLIECLKLGNARNCSTVFRKKLHIWYPSEFWIRLLLFFLFIIEFYRCCMRVVVDNQPFPYEIQCECYKKIASRSWPVLFVLTYFSPYTYPLLFCRKIKLLWSLFSSANQTTGHCSMIYITRLF